MRAAIYARVSDVKKKDDGARRQDIGRQVDLLTEHCKRLGVVEFATYQDDGRSAYTDDINQRPGFRQLLNDVKRHFVQQVFIEDMTRFSRNLSMGLQWLKILDDSGCTLTSLKEGEFEITSAQGWFKSSAALMFAEWDSRIKADKVKSGMRKANNLGKHIGRPSKERVGRKPPMNHTEAGGTTFG